MESEDAEKNKRLSCSLLVVSTCSIKIFAWLKHLAIYEAMGAMPLLRFSALWLHSAPPRLGALQALASLDPALAELAEEVGLIS